MCCCNASSYCFWKKQQIRFDFYQRNHEFNIDDGIKALPAGLLFKDILFLDKNEI